MSYLRLIIFIAVLQFSAFAQEQFGDLIPANRIVDWHNVGVEGGIPRYVDFEINFQDVKNANPGLNDDQVFSAIILDQQGPYKQFRQAYPEAWVSIFFPAGSYEFYAPFVFSPQDSKLIIRGAGSNNTSMAYYQASGDLIRVESNGPVSSFYNLDPVQGFAKGTKIIKTTSPFNEVNNDDYIELVESNGPWIGNYDGGSPGDGNPPENTVGQIVRVKTISSDKQVLELYDELRIDYHDYLNPRIRKIEPIKDIGFEDFYITYLGGTVIGGPSNFVFSYAVNCWISGVESYGTSRAHVGIGNSSHIEVRGSYFRFSTNYGEGGHGYGVSIGLHSTNCLVENNIFSHLRHAMIISRGANGNVYGYNYSTEQRNDPYDAYFFDYPYHLGDINIHGHYPFANLFEGNVVEFISADDWWGSNGPYNTFFRNLITEGNILLEATDYTNVLGCVFYKDFGEPDGIGGVNASGSSFYPPHTMGNHPSSNVFDLYGLYYNSAGGHSPISHDDSWVNKIPYYIDCFINDVSYYRDQSPSFISSPFSWPAMGPGYDYDPNTHYSTPTAGGIPAWDRANDPIRTVASDPIIYRYHITLTPPQFWDGNGSGGYYIVDGNNVGASWSGYFTSSTVVTAVPPSGNWQTAVWSDGVPGVGRAITELDNNKTLFIVFKAPLAASSLQATGGNNQRKIVATNGATYAVYESGGYIWFTKKNAGGGWLPEMRLSSNSPNAKNPSIDFSWPGAEENVHIVWEEDKGGYNEIYYRLSIDAGSTWESTVAVGNLNNDFYSIEDATPVVVAKGTIEAVVMWKYNNAITAGLAMRPNPSLSSNTYVIANTSSNSKHPSLAWGIRASDGTPAFILAYEHSSSGNYYINFKEFTINNSSPYNITYESSPTQLASGPSQNPPVNPSITGSTTYDNKMVIVVWDRKSGSYRRVYYRKRTDGAGYWLSPESFSHGTHNLIKPVVNIDGDNESDQVNVLWECGTHIGWKSKLITGGSWTSVTDLGTGASPSIPGKTLSGTTKAVWMTGSSAPYSVNLTELAPPQVTQYTLTVNSNFGTTTGGGLYDAGSTAYAGLTSGIVSSGSGTRWAFSNWFGDASGSNYAQSNPITMNSNKTANTSWSHEVQLTVNASSGGGSVSGSPSGWYLENSVVGGWTANPSSCNYFVNWQDGYSQPFRPGFNLYLPATIPGANFAPVPLNLPVNSLNVVHLGGGLVEATWSPPSLPQTSNCTINYAVYMRPLCGSEPFDPQGETTSTSISFYTSPQYCEWWEIGVYAWYCGGAGTIATYTIQVN